MARSKVKIKPCLNGRISIEIFNPKFADPFPGSLLLPHLIIQPWE